MAASETIYYVCGICKNRYEGDYDGHFRQCVARCPFDCGTEESIPILDHLSNVTMLPTHVLQLRQLYKEINQAPPESGHQIPLNIVQSKFALTNLLERLSLLKFRVRQAVKMLGDRVSQLTQKSAESLIENSSLASRNRCDLIDHDNLYRSILLLPMTDYYDLLNYAETTFIESRTKITALHNEAQLSMGLMHTQSISRKEDQKGLTSRLVGYRTSSSNGRFIWCIDNLDDLVELNYAVRFRLDSQAFDTKPNGYKISAGLYVIGDCGDGEDTHLSLFLHLNKGPYDALLEWPFNHTVTMRLISQERSEPDVLETIRPDHSSTCFQRPTTQRNVGFGMSQFVSIGLAFASDATYIVDDTMFIEIIIGDSSEAMDELSPSVTEIPNVVVNASDNDVVAPGGSLTSGADSSNVDAAASNLAQLSLNPQPEEPATGELSPVGVDPPELPTPDQQN